MIQVAAAVSMFLVEVGELVEEGQMKIAAFVLVWGVLCGDLRLTGSWVAGVMILWSVLEVSPVQALRR